MYIISLMIDWKNINLSWGENILFDNFNFSLRRGDKLLIRNRSGSGKTTLMKTALGITTIDSGEITIDGVPLTPHMIGSIRSKIFYLDQDVNLPELPVEELIDEIFNFKENRGQSLDKKYLLKLIELFQLEEYQLKSNIRDLSGGERQRVGLIIGFLLKRPIWLLDEPTSALDQELKELVAKELDKLDISALIISHDSCWDNYRTVSWTREER